LFFCRKESRNELKRVIARLSKLKYEIQTNKNLLYFENDGEYFEKIII